VGRVPYKGELNESMQQFIGGLRAGMGYCGSKDILKKQVVLLRIQLVELMKVILIM
jgi:IMP dehydrogenase/GMP reductase